MHRRIIDTHVHIWDLENIRYPWLDGNKTILNRSYTIRELDSVRKAAGVTEGLFVQAANSYEEADYILSMCESTPWMVGAVCWLPLSKPQEMAKILLEKYLDNKYFKGVRHLIHNEPDPEWMLQPPVLESLQILVMNNIPYDIVGIKPVHIETALKVAEKVPGLRMVFDHLNQPPISTNERFGRWGELMAEAAKHNNFWIKISGQGTVTEKSMGKWGARDIRPYVEFCLNHFGEDRALCGGDWPVSLLSAEYGETWKTYISLLEELLNPVAQEKVFWRNARKFYQLSDKELS